MNNGGTPETVRKIQNRYISSVSELKKIRPLIKWTGGKYDEYEKFSRFIPEFDRYIEPFFGGGGVFFAHQPKQAFLNDKSRDLIRFYRNLKNPDLKAELFLFADAWDAIKRLNDDLLSLGKKLFEDFLDLQLQMDELKHELSVIFAGIDPYLYQPIFDTDFCSSPLKFRDFLHFSVVDKFKRILRISQKEGRRFEAEELDDHFETALKSGLYLYHRQIMNDNFQGRVTLAEPRAIATWYFVREFCYASMFRYNSRGDFNIPYGGIAYNRKNFRNKVELIYGADLQKLLNSTQFYNLDFEEFLKEIQPTKEDFIFLDPPYDSEFSEYDQNAFTQEDQRRLATYLKSTSAKWMLVIKETSFILSLYKRNGVFIENFDKNYTYNVRGRNNRKTQHLIITNYPQ